MEQKSLFRFQICPCSWSVAVATHPASRHNSVFPGCCSLRTCMPSRCCDAFTLKCLGPGEMDRYVTFRPELEGLLGGLSYTSRGIPR